MWLGELRKRYRAECALFLDNKPHTRRDVRYRIPILLALFDRNRDARTLSALDVARYSAVRHTGDIRYGDGAKAKPVRQRTVHAHLVLLRSMLRWACTIPAVDTHPDGPRWLDRNPLDGIRFEREKNPVSSVASWERFVKTRATLQRPAANADSDAMRATWRRLELARCSPRRQGGAAV